MLEMSEFMVSFENVAKLQAHGHGLFSISITLCLNVYGIWPLLATEDYLGGM